MERMSEQRPIKSCRSAGESLYHLETDRCLHPRHHLLGVLAMLLTPREENPQILVPGAQVSVTLPGASAKEVEELVVTPLEGILSEMTGVDHTYAVAQNSFGAVAVEFKVGQPKEASLVKLYDRVMSNRARLPSDAGIPQIRSVDVDDLAVVTVTLASPSYDDYGLKRLADRMAERLRSLDNISVVTVRGGHDREIRVELDPERLQAFGLTLGQVSAAPLTPAICLCRFRKQFAKILSKPSS